MTSRELVKATMEFRNTERVPREMYALPWAEIYHKTEVENIFRDFPRDTVTAPGFYKTPPVTRGDATEVGEYIDEWGCVFTNMQRGVIGEVKQPIVTDDEWEDVGNVHIPRELLTVDVDKVNEFCRNTDKYVTAGYCPRPFEQLQFIRGTENLYIDLMMRPRKMFAFIEKMHDFYCELLTLWAKTDVDGLFIMDDWGAQNSLLVSPAIWKEIFMPMYRDYIDIAHKYGKKIKMHSDGYILDIIPYLIDLGLDTINAQIFCIGLDKLKQFRGHITFWGEIDRQHLLPFGTKEDIIEAVKNIKDTFWMDGGCVAHCEFGPGAKPENVYQAFQTWSELV